MISMNYENVYRYLCFCCTDAVDCGGWVVLDLFTLTPVSGTGTGFDPLPSRERGNNGVWFGLVLPRPVDTALKPVTSLRHGRSQ